MRCSGCSYQMTIPVSQFRHWTSEFYTDAPPNTAFFLKLGLNSRGSPNVSLAKMAIKKEVQLPLNLLNFFILFIIMLVDLDLCQSYLSLLKDKNVQLAEVVETWFWFELAFKSKPLFLFNFSKFENVKNVVNKSVSQSAWTLWKTLKIGLFWKLYDTLKLKVFYFTSIDI